MSYWLIIALLAEFWIAGMFWITTYLKFAHTVGFKNAFITSLNWQIELIKSFFLFMIGYNPNLKAPIIYIPPFDVEENQDDKKEDDDITV